MTGVAIAATAVAGIVTGFCGGAFLFAYLASNSGGR